MYIQNFITLISKSRVHNQEICTCENKE